MSGENYVLFFKRRREIRPARSIAGARNGRCAKDGATVYTTHFWIVDFFCFSHYRQWFYNNVPLLRCVLWKPTVSCKNRHDRLLAVSRLTGTVATVGTQTRKYSPSICYEKPCKVTGVYTYACLGFVWFRFRRIYFYFPMVLRGKRSSDNRQKTVTTSFCGIPPTSNTNRIVKRLFT